MSHPLTVQPGAVPARFRNAGIALFLLILAAGAAYVISHLVSDLESVAASSVFPFVLLGIALVIALGFEFVNGFHDTANAVATVIYTHSLSPAQAAVWSGLWNFLGVVLSSGAVAYGIVALLPVELVLHVGTGAGFAMVFALLIVLGAPFQLLGFNLLLQAIGFVLLLIPACFIYYRALGAATGTGALAQFGISMLVSFTVCFCCCFLPLFLTYTMGASAR